LSDLG